MTDRLQPGNENPPARPAGPRPATPHPVGDKEDWASVASKQGVTVRELIANNCGLNVTPQEINWYLHLRVGCKFFQIRKTRHHMGPRRGQGPVSSRNPTIKTLYGGNGSGLRRRRVARRVQAAEEGRGLGWIIQQLHRSHDTR